jgi:superfamily I DNA/RNA helicase
MPWNDNLEGPALEIASSNESPLRVQAGPGTGKSFALMRRVARLIEEEVDPERILLVTFTRVSARDLERELDALSYPEVSRVQKGTLHSLCFSMLHQANVLRFTGRIPRPLLTFEERFLLEDLRLYDNFGDGSLIRDTG